MVKRAWFQWNIIIFYRQQAFIFLNSCKFCAGFHLIRKRKLGVWRYVFSSLVKIKLHERIELKRKDWLAAWHRKRAQWKIFTINGWFIFVYTSTMLKYHLRRVFEGLCAASIFAVRMQMLLLLAVVLLLLLLSPAFNVITLAATRLWAKAYS